jgi:hypothetical protein
MNADFWRDGGTAREGRIRDRSFSLFERRETKRVRNWVACERRALQVRLGSPLLGYTCIAV